MATLKVNPQIAPTESSPKVKHLIPIKYISSNSLSTKHWLADLYSLLLHFESIRDHFSESSQITLGPSISHDVQWCWLYSPNNLSMDTTWPSFLARSIDDLNPRIRSTQFITHSESWDAHIRDERYSWHRYLWPTFWPLVPIIGIGINESQTPTLVSVPVPLRSHWRYWYRHRWKNSKYC